LPNLGQTYRWDERCLRVGEGTPPRTHRVGFGVPDVALRRAERSVPCALFDFERIVSADSAPRDTGCPEVVERDGLARPVCCEEFGSRDSRHLQIHAKRPRQVAFWNFDNPLAFRLLLHGRKQWQEGRFDRDPPRRIALGRFQALPRLVSSDRCTWIVACSRSTSSHSRAASSPART